MSYAIQKGLIKPHQRHAVYGAAHYDGVLTCGNIWKPWNSRMAKCPEMKRQYQIYQKNRQLRDDKGRWPYCGSTSRKYVNRMKDAERKGKDAWKLCKVGAKEADLAEDSGLSLDLMPVVPEYMAEGSTYLDPGPSGGLPKVQSYPPAAYQEPMGTGGATGMEDGNKKLMLYGGIAAGGLLLLLLLRR